MAVVETVDRGRTDLSTMLDCLTPPGRLILLRLVPSSSGLNFRFLRRWFLDHFGYGPRLMNERVVDDSDGGVWVC